MDREQKTAVVEKLTEELKDAKAIFAVDYRGISVPQAAELRTGLRDADTRFRVVKNRLTLRAVDAAGIEELKDHLTGPTALAFVHGDAALAAKTISRLGSEWEVLGYKGGLMDGESLDPDSFTAIAKLPGREALNAQMAGVVASPLTGLVRGLGSMIQGLALQLGQIAEQGLVTGEAPSAEETGETPPEEEAPAGGEEAPAGGEEASAGGEEAPAEGDGESAAKEPFTEEPAEEEQPAAEESPPDPEPAESPEESSQEEAPEDEDAGQGEPAETGEGDQDIAEEPATEDSEDAASDEDDENKEEGE